MKYTTLISFLVAVLLLAGCYSDNNYISQLDTAEGLLDTAPDSALVLLQEIDSHHLSRADNALYALLLSQARDKCYIDETNDSLINIAVEYYGDSKDKYREMLAYYYHGRVKYNACEYVQSLVSMTTAFDIASIMNDYYWSGRAAEQIANIYEQNSYNAESKYYASISYENLKKSGKQPYINYALLAQSRALLNNNENAESIVIAKQLLDSATIYSDSLLENLTHRVLAKAYFGIADYENTINEIQIVKDRGDFSTDLQCLMGLAYMELGEHKKSRELYINSYQELSSNNTPLVYMYARKNGDVAKAYNMLERLYQDLDSVLVQMQTQNFASAVSDYYAYAKQLKEVQLKHTRTIHICTIILFIIIIAAIAVVFLRLYINQQNKIERNIIVAQNFQEILAVKETEFTKVQKEVQNLLSSKFDIVNKLCQTYYENKTAPSLKKKISNEVENMITMLSDNSQYIAQLESTIDTHIDCLTQSFRKDYPNINRADYLLFIYSVLGFSSVAISLFLKEDDVKSVYNRKRRLKDKIKNSTVEHRHKYLNAMR